MFRPQLKGVCLRHTSSGTAHSRLESFVAPAESYMCSTDQSVLSLMDPSPDEAYPLDRAVNRGVRSRVENRMIRLRAEEPTFTRNPSLDFVDTLQSRC